MPMPFMTMSVGEIAAITEKTLPVGADLAVIEDSAACNAKKRIQLANLETLLEAVMDLNQLQGAITDAQVPDSITINTANAGDSATAFFTTGQIERARGGTGADTSAYGDGLIGSLSAGTTADIDTMTELETAIGGIDILAATEIDTLAELNTIITNADLVPQATHPHHRRHDQRDHLFRRRAGSEHQSGHGRSASRQRSTLAARLLLRFPIVQLQPWMPLAKSRAITISGAPTRARRFSLMERPRCRLIGTLVSDTPLDGQVPRFNRTGHHDHLGNILSDSRRQRYPTPIQRWRNAQRRDWRDL